MATYYFHLKLSSGWVAMRPVRDVRDYLLSWRLLGHP